MILGEKRKRWTQKSKKNTNDRFWGGGEGGGGEHVRQDETARICAQDFLQTRKRGFLEKCYTFKH